MTPRSFIHWFCWLGLAAILAVIMLGRLSFMAIYLDWFSHFPTLYLLGAILFTIVLLVIRRWASACFGLVVVMLCLVLLLGPFTARHIRPGPTSEVRLVVAIANVLVSNPKAKEVIAGLPDADVIGLLETPPSWTSALDTAEARWPQQWRDLQNNPSGMSVLGHTDIESVDWFTLTPGEMPALHMELDLQGEEVHLLVVHTMSPQSVSKLKTRDAQFKKLAQVINDLKGNLVLIGDLNASTWSPSLTTLLYETGLRASRATSGMSGTLMGTWPSRFPSFLRVPIDHCFIRGNIESLSNELFDIPGSDHVGLLVELAIGPGDTLPKPVNTGGNFMDHPIPMFWRHIGKQ